MKGKLHTALTVVLALVLLGSVGAILHRQLDYRQGEADYADAESLAGIPQETVVSLQSEKRSEAEPEQTVEELPAAEEEPDPEEQLLSALAQTDIAALRAVNSEVLGWITIPGTAVNYPILRGTDNDYYLDHNWKKERSSVGAIFMDCRSSGEFAAENTLIYGHNMKNGSMFGCLKHYATEGYWEAHPAVYIVDDTGVRQFDIYAVYEAGVETATYKRTFEDDTEKEAFLNHGLRKSVVNTGVVPAAEDSVITLSTCTGSGYATRWVVQAVQQNRE